MRRLLPLLILATLALAGCVQPNINLFGEPGAAFKEQTLDGQGKDKVLLVSVDGLISEYPRESFMRTRQSMVQEVAAQLKLARRDKSIKAVVLKVDSPGGTVTASDVIHHELTEYKKASGAKVVAALMGVAASGGYYVALPADHIAAHPTTITGSVGVIFVMPRLAGLMDKLGVGVDVSKSGSLKDMGSPFRPATQEEKALTDAMTKAQAQRFLNLVQHSRKLSPEAMGAVATARVFTAQEARKLGLIDSVGYLEDAVNKARELAGLAKDARVVTYRRKPESHATWYQRGAEDSGGAPQALVGVDLGGLMPPKAGLYFLWPPAYVE